MCRHFTWTEIPTEYWLFSCDKLIRRLRCHVGHMYICKPYRIKKISHIVYSYTFIVCIYLYAYIIHIKYLSSIQGSYIYCILIAYLFFCIPRVFLLFLNKQNCSPSHDHHYRNHHHHHDSLFTAPVIKNTPTSKQSFCRSGRWSKCYQWNDHYHDYGNDYDEIEGKITFRILIVTAWLDPKISPKFTTTCHSFPHLSQQHLEISITLFHTLTFSIT